MCACWLKEQLAYRVQHEGNKGKIRILQVQPQGFLSLALQRVIAGSPSVNLLTFRHLHNQTARRL